ncbi:hypothetical protein BH23THE1_BH23THE1_12430 [soil metagenome]
MAFYTYNANAQFDKSTLYDDFNSGVMSGHTATMINGCYDMLAQYNDLSPGLKSAQIGLNLNNDLLVCDHNLLYLDGVCQAVGTRATSDSNSFCVPVDQWINIRGIDAQPRPNTFLGAEAFS